MAKIKVDFSQLAGAITKLDGTTTTMGTSLENLKGAADQLRWAWSGPDYQIFYSKYTGAQRGAVESGKNLQDAIGQMREYLEKVLSKYRTAQAEAVKYANKIK